MPESMSGQLHFRCVFDIRRVAPHDDPWASLVKITRDWIADTPRANPPVTTPAFYAAWYFIGGEWHPLSQPGYFVKTLREIGNGTDRAPQYWAVRYDHPCSQPGRMWRTNIGITRIEDCVFRFAVQTGHYMRVGFLGREPTPPVPTAPRIVTSLLGAPAWEASAGIERLSTGVKPLRQGDGEDFRARLENAGRACPVVLVSRDFLTNQPKIDPAKLAWLLAGAASVYECESTGVDKELEWCLGRRFCCWNGMVRVYQLPVRFGVPGDPKRHRYLSGRQIDQQGQDVTIEMLVRGIARRALTRVPGAVVSLADVAALERERRIAELKAAVTGAGRDEWTGLLEEENTELEKRSREKDETIQQLRIDLADAEDRASRFDFDRKAATARAAGADKTVRALRAKADAMDRLQRLPDTLAMVATCIQGMFPNRIAFTERAISSADQSGYRDIHEAWRCLYAMATLLHDMFFEPARKVANIEQAFRESTGNRLAMTEGGPTKSDAKLMRKRTDRYGECEIDATPHVKFDKDTTRAYFGLFTRGSEHLIVVSYFGHLDTAGTRRRT
jgi:hypothetical protein